jgi:hypothetical protein
MRRHHQAIVLSPWVCDDLVLDVPTRHDLCRCHTVIAGDSCEPRVAQVDVQQRAVTLELHTTAPVSLEHASFRSGRGLWAAGGSSLTGARRAWSRFSCLTDNPRR